jgi:chaperonin GroEL (HSP60 family)
MMTHHLDDIDAAILLDAFLLVGLKGKIVIKKSNTNKSCVEVNTGCAFDDILSAFKVIENEYSDAFVICVDGYVESTSEITHLLEQASLTKETIFLFVRGLSEEVSHTLKVNYDRKTLRVIPVVVPFDLDGINLLNDVSVISGNDVVSSNKGQLFNSISLDKHKRVDVVKLFSNKVIIENKSTNKRVDQHIVMLQKSINDCDNDAKKDLLSKRIQRLGTLQATIYLPEENYSSRSFCFDRCIRSIKSSIDFGTCTVNEKIYPASSYDAAILYKDKLFSTLNDIGCIIE